MSLVPSFVQLYDGRWAKNPRIGNFDWFICYDDDDPIELVIALDSGMQPRELLGSLSPVEYRVGRFVGNSGRYFLPDGVKPSGPGLTEEFVVRQAASWWIYHTRSAPTEEMIQIHGGIFDQRPRVDCVIYPLK